MGFARTQVAAIICLSLLLSGYSFAQMARRNYNLAPSRRNEVPSYMMNLYLALSKQNNGEMSRSLDTVRHVNAKKVISNRGPLKVFYDLSSLSKDEFISRDELHLYLSHFRSKSGRSTSVYKLKVKDLFSRRLISRRLIQVNSTGWYKVSLRRWTSRWIRSQGSNRGVKIVLRRNGKTVNIAEPPYKRKSASSFLPYLILYCKTKSESPSLRDFNLQHLVSSRSRKFNSKARGHIRQPRAATNTSCNSIPVQITVKLQPVEGTLIAPCNYTTKKCIGNCLSSQAHGHAKNSTKYNSTVPAPCVPKKVKQLHVLYKDATNNFILKIVPNAIIEQCSCSSSLPSTP